MGAIDYSVIQRVEIGYGANTVQSPIRRVPGVKRPKHEVDHSSALVPRLRMNGATTPLITRLHGVDKENIYQKKKYD